MRQRSVPKGLKRVWSKLNKGEEELIQPFKFGKRKRIIIYNRGERCFLNLQMKLPHQRVEVSIEQLLMQAHPKLGSTRRMCCPMIH